MVGDTLSEIRTAGRTGRLGIAVPLLLAAGAGTVGGIVLWITRGWRDGLACYAAAVVVIGLVLMWRTAWQPTLAAGTARAAQPGGSVEAQQASHTG